MGRSQRHLREVRGYDAAGNTPYASDDSPIRPLIWTKDLAGQSVNFKTSYFPTGTNFALSAVPTGMSLNASTGVLNGTPTAVQVIRATLTVTYLSDIGPVIAKVPVFIEIGAAAGAIAAGAYTQNVAITPLDFAASFPGASSFALSAIPAGLTLSAAGVLSGTPTTVSSNGAVTLTLGYPNFADTRAYSWSWAVTA